MMTTVVAFLLMNALLGCNVLDERIRKIVDERIGQQSQKGRQEGRQPESLATPNPGRTAGDGTPTSPPEGVVPESREPTALGSMRFLAQLDELLSHVKPNLPEQLDTSLVKCLTQQQTNADQGLKRATEAVVQQKRERDKNRNDMRSTFYRTFLPVHARLDCSWKNSTYVNACVCFDKSATTPEDDPKKGRPYFMFDGKCAYSNCKRGPVSKVYSKPIFEYAFDYLAKSGATYSWLSEMTVPLPPLLMRLMDDQKIAAPARLYCQVHDIEATRDLVTIQCRNVPGEDLTIVAHGNPTDTRKLNSGDVISVPLANTSRDTNGVLRKDNATWIADADIGSIAMESAAVCLPPEKSRRCT